jgi:hypothetical protein
MVEGGQQFLAWRFMMAIPGGASWMFFVDAHTGEEVRRENLIFYSQPVDSPEIQPNGKNQEPASANKSALAPSSGTASETSTSDPSAEQIVPSDPNSAGTQEE